MSSPPIVLSRWARALRAYSFTATIIPVGCATLLVRAEGVAVDPLLFALMLLCALLFHAGTNLLNDYYDFILGFDTAAASGSSGLLLNGEVTPAWMRGWGLFYLACGTAAGLVLAAIRGLPLLVAGLAGLAGAWFYSRPNGAKVKGLGEPFVFILMGPLLFGSTAYAVGGRVPFAALWPALSCGALVSCIMLVNNLRDLQMDRVAGFVTLPMRIGPQRAERLYAALICSAYAALPVSVLLGQAPLARLLPLFSLPIAWHRIHDALKADCPEVQLAEAPQKTAGLYLVFGLLLAVGLLAQRP